MAYIKKCSFLTNDTLVEKRRFYTSMDVSFEIGQVVIILGTWELENQQFSIS